MVWPGVLLPLHGPAELAKGISTCAGVTRARGLQVARERLTFIAGAAWEAALGRAVGRGSAEGRW